VVQSAIEITAPEERSHVFGKPGGDVTGNSLFQASAHLNVRVMVVLRDDHHKATIQPLVAGSPGFSHSPGVRLDGLVAGGRNHEQFDFGAGLTVNAGKLVGQRLLLGRSESASEVNHRSRVWNIDECKGAERTKGQCGRA
jgi:hypothetical protein